MKYYTCTNRNLFIIQYIKLLQFSENFTPMYKQVILTFDHKAELCYKIAQYLILDIELFDNY